MLLEVGYGVGGETWSYFENETVLESDKCRYMKCGRLWGEKSVVIRGEDWCWGEKNEGILNMKLCMGQKV